MNNINYEKAFEIIKNLKILKISLNEKYSWAFRNQDVTFSRQKKCFLIQTNNKSFFLPFTNPISKNGHTLIWVINDTENYTFDIFEPFESENGDLYCGFPEGTVLPTA